MTGMVCSFHVSAVDHLFSGVFLFPGAVVCTRLSHRRGVVVPFSVHGVVVKLMKSVGYGWIGKIRRYTR
jgi:hypothetical protein